MNDWFKSFSATFAGGAVAIALVAIPTYVWLPREFDDLRSRSESTFEAAKVASEEARAARDASEGARISSISTLHRIDKLVESIARVVAKPIYIDDGSLHLETSQTAPYAKLSSLGIIPPDRVMPPDVVMLLASSGKMDKFKYANFDGNDWIFVDKSDFNQFSLEDQKKIEEALSRSNTTFIKD